MIISHTHEKYLRRWDRMGAGRYNGAYYYSREIVQNIIPNVQTTRSWITVNLPEVGCDHAIVFIHNNLHPEHYEWLKKYKDIVLVCGVKETLEKVAHIGRAIFLPLSIDVEEVQRHIQPKKYEAAYAGRPSKRGMRGINLPKGIDVIEGLERERFLDKMAQYKTIYGVGRVALEAKALGCEVGVYDKRYPDPDKWVVIDNREAAEILQAKLDKIDKEPERIQSAKPDTNWKKDALVEYARAQGIKINQKDTKKKILEKING